MAMARADRTAVGAAFEMLLEEIGAVIEDVKSTGTQAIRHEDYVAARKVLQQADVLTSFREKVASLRKEWASLYSGQSEELKKKVSRRNLGKIRKGLRTREEAYCIPILRVLEERGGSGEVGPVLDRVHQLMSGILKPVDAEPLRSYPNAPRWRNSAQWARNSMVQQGLLAKGSAFGVWEITDQGRDYLAKNG